MISPVIVSHFQSILVVSSFVKGCVPVLQHQGTGYAVSSGHNLWLSFSFPLIKKLKSAVPALLTIPPEKWPKIIDLCSERDDADLLDKSEAAVWLKFDGFA